MPDTQEQQVLEGLQSALEGISTLASPAYRNTIGTVHMEAEDGHAIRGKGPLPAISVLHKDTVYTPRPGSWEDATMTVVLMCYLDAATYETRLVANANIVDDVKHALFLDMTLGDTAIASRVTRSKDNKSIQDSNPSGTDLAEAALIVEIDFERELDWS